VFLGLIDLLLDSDEYGDEFLRKIDEDDAKQKKRRKSKKLKLDASSKGEPKFEENINSGGVLCLNVCIILAPISFCSVCKTHILEVKIIYE